MESLPNILIGIRRLGLTMCGALTSQKKNINIPLTVQIWEEEMKAGNRTEADNVLPESINEAILNCLLPSFRPKNQS